MNENYIVINGKKAELTEEQLKALGIKLEKRKNPFARVDDGDSYFYINHYSSVLSWAENHDGSDDSLTDCCNYFNNEDFAHQVALHQLLYRKLLKFAYDNECEDTAEWDCRNYHYCIVFDANDKCYETQCAKVVKNGGSVYFSSNADAHRAIEAVVEPFMRAHPDFVG